MAAIRDTRAPHLRQRSTAAVILSRDDAATARRDLPAVGADADRPAARRRRWPIVLTWIALGAAIAALWAVLLLGDSLRASG